MRSKLPSSMRLRHIAQILIDVDNRCMAADGPVTPTNQEIRNDELRKIYLLATGESRVTGNAPNATPLVAYGKALKRALAALERVQPQVRGVLCVQDVEYAIAEAKAVLE